MTLKSGFSKRLPIPRPLGEYLLAFEYLIFVPSPRSLCLDDISIALANNMPIADGT